MKKALLAVPLVIVGADSKRFAQRGMVGWQSRFTKARDDA